MHIPARCIPTLDNDYIYELTVKIFPSFLPQVDYEVCHDILVSYLESFDTYANFK